MKKTGKAAAAGLAAVLSLCLAVPAWATGSLDDAKKKKSSLEEEKKKTEAAIKSLEGLKSDAAAYVKKLDANLEAISDELSRLGEEIEIKEDQIEATKAELADAKLVEKDQYESMKLRIKYMYEKGDSSYVDLLMESGSLSELLNKAEYIGKISAYDRQKLDEYVATKEQIQTKEIELETEHGELLGLQEETEAKHASVEQLLSAKQSELKKYESQISAAEGQLSEYEKDIKAQEDSIKAIEAEMRRKEEEARKKPGRRQRRLERRIKQRIWGTLASHGPVRPADGSPRALAAGPHQRREPPPTTRESTSEPPRAPGSLLQQTERWWSPHTAIRLGIM